MIEEKPFQVELYLDGTTCEVFHNVLATGVHGGMYFVKHRVGNAELTKRYQVSRIVAVVERRE